MVTCQYPVLSPCLPPCHTCLGPRGCRTREPGRGTFGVCEGGTQALPDPDAPLVDLQLLILCLPHSLCLGLARGCPTVYPVAVLCGYLPPLLPSVPLLLCYVHAVGHSGGLGIHLEGSSAVCAYSEPCHLHFSLGWGWGQGLCPQDTPPPMLSTALSWLVPGCAWYKAHVKHLLPSGAPSPWTGRTAQCTGMWSGSSRNSTRLASPSGRGLDPMAEGGRRVG